MDHVDNQEEIKNSIVSLEHQFPVDKWEIQGVNIWPYVRIILYMHLLTRERETKIKNESYNTNFKTFLSFRKLKLPYQLIKALINQAFFFSKLKSKKILFFGSHIHRVQQDGLYFNRFYDAIVEEYKLKEDVYMLEYQKVYENSYNDKAIIKLAENLKDYKLLLKLKRNSKINLELIKLEQYDAFLETLKKNNINTNLLRITKEDLIKWVGKVNALKPFFKSFYKKAQPQKVIFLGYYGLDDLYAALITANEMKITTVDFQHGPQTNVHMAYAHWNKVPEKGFNTMPSAFWNWDKPSQDNIESWAKNTKTVKSILFGQPYINHWLKQSRNIIEDKNLIFYSMQTSPLDLFTKPLIEVIKNSNYKWILRMHPRNKTTLEEFETFLKLNGIWNNIEIQDAFSTPLPETLSRSALHVTNYSGCVIEARMMGIPTIIVHQIGFEMFEGYLDGETVIHLDQNEFNFSVKFQTLVEELIQRKLKTKIITMANPLD
ncbi:hypothetical protein [uncultured Lacinutrix sp.]|uniref:hypothetical protein n=1 Tax=uncultured Lacinutrix sp. TaxID=574032 RepID=UPI0026111718|nr:hypothetical protein [uncultured Lacinutrix sp.]